MPEYLTGISDFIRSNLGVPLWVQFNIAKSLLIFLLLAMLHFITMQALARGIKEPKNLYHWQKTVHYLYFIVGTLLVGRVWFAGIQSLATILGLASAGIAIAMREPLVNLAGWAFIVWRRPFSVGDRIQIGDFHGDVVDLRPFMFTLMEIGNWVHADQSSGRLLMVPNGKIFSEVLANYNMGFHFIWNEAPVMVTFESDWEKAKGILGDIGQRHSLQLSERAQQKIRQIARTMMIFFSTLEPEVYTTVEASGVLLTVRYICEPRKRRQTYQAIWEDTLREFAKHDDIQLAYPTQRIYYRPQEEPGAQPKEPQPAEKAAVSVPDLR